MLSFLKRTTRTNGETKGRLDPRLAEIMFNDFERRLAMRRVAIRGADGISGDTVVTNNGVSPTASIVFAAALGLAGALAGAGWALFSSGPTATGPADSAYEVIFYDSEGNVIPIQRHGANDE